MLLLFRHTAVSMPVSYTHLDVYKRQVWDGQARAYAKEHGLPVTGGSDVHSTTIFGGGTAFPRKLADGQDFIKALRGGEDYVITDGVRWYAKDGRLLVQAGA